MTASRTKLKKSLIRALIVLIGLGLIVGYVAWSRLLRKRPQQLASDSPEEYFKYGSIGTEDEEGLPYYVWMVLPRVFPEHLPKEASGSPKRGGYAAFGLGWEPGREVPVGISKRTIGFPRVGINCAICHSTTYRTSPDDLPVIVPTGPSQCFDSQAYLRFFSACASDPRFTAANLMEEINYNFELDLLDKLLYRFLIIPQTRRALLQQKDRYQWTYKADRPAWGPGRIDPFNPVKFHQLRLKDDNTIGNSDMMPLWKMSKREGQPLHWDGLNDDLTEVVITGAIGDGATNKSLPVEKLKDLEEYLRHKEPPPYPFPDRMNPGLAKLGSELFQVHCADCHSPNGSKFGQVIELSQLKTDSHRADMWTKAAVDRYHHYSDGYPWDFRRFVDRGDQDGYVAVPLDGIWLRAPYLHNGSVPTLEALLLPANRRPQEFFRGYDVYDQNQTGFISGEEARNTGFLFETSLPGNSNQGHEYGTQLSDEEKKSLVEYLKAL